MDNLLRDQGVGFLVSNRTASRWTHVHYSAETRAGAQALQAAQESFRLELEEQMQRQGRVLAGTWRAGPGVQVMDGGGPGGGPWDCGDRCAGRAAE